MPWALWKDLPAAGGYHTFKPAQKHRLPWLAAAVKELPEGVFGTVPSRPNAPRLLGSVYGSRHNPDYLEAVSRARLGLYLMGGNALGHQFWEFAALECALVAAHPSTHPAPEEDTQEWEHFDEAGSEALVEGDDFVYFRTESELRDHLRALTAHPHQAQAMAERARAKVAPFTSINRGRYVLECLQR